MHASKNIISFQNDHKGFSLSAYSYLICIGGCFFNDVLKDSILVKDLVLLLLISAKSRGVFINMLSTLIDF